MAASCFTRRVARSGIVLAVAVAVLSAPTAGLAQGIFKGNNRWVYALVGAAIAGVPAFVAAGNSSGDDFCNNRKCGTTVAALVGGGVGFLIGREADAKYARRMAAGPSIRYDFRNVQLGLVPDRMASFPGGAAVIGLGGARVVMRDGPLYPRASGVRGIEDVAVLPQLGLLVLSTASSLLAFPVGGDSVQGRVIDKRGGSTMEVFHERLAVAGLDSLRLLQLRRGDESITVETVSGRESLDYITDMAYSSFGRTAWVLIDDRLLSLTPELEKVGEVVLPAAGRSVRARGQRLAVAAGTNGVYVLDATDPAAPRVVKEYSGVRFAYAADLDGDLLYVAAGPEGMVVVDIGGPQQRVLGVAREVRFASDVVVSEAGDVWILDRDGRRVQIAEFKVENVERTSGGLD